jgi:FAD/FMN-containing dehydrogenase
MPTEYRSFPLASEPVSKAIMYVVCLQGVGLSLEMGLFQQLLDLPGIMERHGDDGNTLPDPLATVGGGITRTILNQHALRHAGMQFLVNPGADVTVGGMVAKESSGDNRRSLWDDCAPKVALVGGAKLR